ncbi:hypothetical protein MKW94_026538 [Papaver nudicaule]|uniref:Core Histone H2A/H2B/H3 domain-containing protein n=1 Tax=Papaver nudicaule TaxID=74823 RepID=A0AA41VHV6_PAPNU|nr:hypothetical protein [Papaver nudicaule]
MDQSGMQEPKQEREQQPTGEAVTSPESEQETEMVASDSPQTEQPPSFSAPQHQIGYPPVQHFHQQHQQHQHQQQQLQVFWSNQMQEVEQATDFKNHTLPLARIKKIMKADEDVRMISAEAPVVFAKACEMFILELTLRSWIHTEENKRRTLQKNDIAAAITRTDIFDFLVDIVPRDDLKEETLGIPRPEPLPYYFVPGHPSQVGHPAMTYAAANQPRPPMAFMPWVQPPPQQQQGQQQQPQQTDA